MAVKLSEVNGISNSTNLKYVADEESEKNDIPAEDKIQGTEVLVIESGKTYRMNSSGEWVQKSGSGGGGGGSDLPSVTAEDNGDLLGVVNGEWGKTDAPYTETEQTQNIVAQQNVTTADMGGICGVLVAAAAVPDISDSVIVSWNGTDYDCELTEYEGTLLCGAMTSPLDPPDWDAYPFAIGFANMGGAAAQIMSETAGTYAVKVDTSKKIVTPSDTFKAAVTASINEIDTLVNAREIISNGNNIVRMDKTLGEIKALFASGKAIVLKWISNTSVQHYCPLYLKITTEGSTLYALGGSGTLSATATALYFSAATDDDYPEAPLK